MGEVALVTGASSGIGAEFARQLSQRGYEVILVARREERMRELASRLQGHAHVIACDLVNEAASLAAKVAVLDKPVDVRLRSPKSGQVRFACGMDMYRGAVVVAGG